MKNIYLCGFMGCGKTTIASALGQLLSIPYFDTDELIVKKYHKAIPEIFKQFGAEFFRAAETQIIRETQSMNGIFATGGGILTTPENEKLLRHSGSVVYLKTPFQICYERIQGDANRPIAVSKSKEELFLLYQQREPAYSRCADLIVEPYSSPLQTARQIINQLNI